MARLKIFWTEEARSQRQLTFQYWNKKTGSTNYSKKLKNQISSTLELIAEYPFMGKTASFPNTNEFALGNFSLFYQVKEEKIIITAFWDNRNDPDVLAKVLKD